MTTETRTTHTPGPWVVEGEDWVIGEGENPREPGCVRLVCVGGDSAEWAANARLIAAAPELLAALERCVDAMYIVSMDTGDDFSGAPEAALAAIAKARGDA